MNKRFISLLIFSLITVYVGSVWGTAVIFALMESYGSSGLMFLAAIIITRLWLAHLRKMYPTG